MNRSQNYWNKRTNRLDSITNKNIKYTEKELQKYYQDIYDSVAKDAELLYEKYQKALLEGKPAGVSTLYQLDRYADLMDDIEKKVDRLGTKLDHKIDNALQAEYRAIYDNASITLPDVDEKTLGFFNKVNKNYIKEKVHTPWIMDGLDFSDRIWGQNVQKLKFYLKDNLVTDLAKGKSLDKISADIQQRFGVSFRDAQRLVRTESAHIQNEASKDAYQRHGITKVQWLVGAGCCDECEEIADDGPYDIDNVPEIPHCRCRCSISPIVEYDDEKD